MMMQNKRIVSLMSCIVLFFWFGVVFAEPVSSTENHIVEYEVSASQFVVNVDGVDVSFDWSAMPEANSYILAVALLDFAGNVDIGTLQFFDMGTQRAFTTAGLPSGMIFNAVILAYTDQGVVVSDTVNFMPFSGTVTYFDSGGVLLRIADSGGIGNFTVSGHFNGNAAYLTQISGDDGSGNFTLTLVNEKPAVYTKGDFVFNFDSGAASTSAIGILKAAKRTVSQDVVDCQDLIQDEMSKLDRDYDRDILQLHILQLKVFSFLNPDLLFDPENIKFNPNPEQKVSAKGKLWNIFQFIQAAAEGRHLTYQEDKAKLKKQYDECEGSLDPFDPNKVVIDTSSCSIPAGAQLQKNTYKNSMEKFFLLDGVKVGPYKYWRTNDKGDIYLDRESCNDKSGKLQGWSVWYWGNGNKRSATYYKDGIKDGHEYSYFCDNELVWSDETWVSGVMTYRQTFNKAGVLCTYWDIAGDGKGHIVCKHIDSPECEE